MEGVKWMDGLYNEWMNGWMDYTTNYEWIDGLYNEWMNGWIDCIMNG